MKPRGLAPLAHSDPRPEFVGALLHKMSQPLTALRGSLELGLLLSRTPAEYRQAIQEAMEQVDRMVRLKVLINDLLQTENLTCGLEETPLRQVLLMAAEGLKPAASEGGVNLEVHCPEGLHVIANPKRLSQAFSSLLAGLLAYRVGESTLALNAFQNETHAVVEMSASSGSIPTQDLANFFDPFFLSTFRRGMAAMLEDCGPNLALARRIVEAVGGGLRVENCPAAPGFRLEANLPLAASCATAPKHSTTRAGIS